MASFRACVDLQLNEVRRRLQENLAQELERLGQDLVASLGDASMSPRMIEQVGASVSIDLWKADLWRNEEDEETKEQPLHMIKEVSKDQVSERSENSAPLMVTIDSVTNFQHRQISMDSCERVRSVKRQPLVLHPMWSQEVRVTKSNSLRNTDLMRRPSRFAIRAGEEALGTGCLQMMVFRPSSLRCLMWDIVCFIAIVYDTIMVPLFSAFPIDTTLALQILETSSTVVWVIDMFATFFRGFLDTHTGFIEMRLNKIARHYLSTWFLPDIAMLVVDMISLFLVDQKAAATVTLLRLFRNIRILRLLKIAGRLSRLKEMFVGLDYGLEWTSVYLATAMTVLKQICVISLLCHFSGCAWYALGTLAMENTWIKAIQASSGSDTDIMYMYVTSLHWSLTQFTPASIDVAAVNVPERIFSVVVTLAGLIVFSLFIGSINQALGRLAALTAQETRQHLLVRRYVTEKQVSVELAADILRCIQQRGLGKESSKLVLSDIKILESLPRKLLVKLQQEVGMPVLESHGLLRHVSNLGSDTELATLCYRALKEQSVVFGEELYQETRCTL
ncbi:unnamed protein product [Durusdinium trenchii]|uniref:Ion transport domain-containing protein n=1 Tax=Durusdinium trenchii TaxID=1381693 RepID=A0ABP0PEC8_9DINO